MTGENARRVLRRLSEFASTRYPARHPAIAALVLIGCIVFGIVVLVPSEASVRALAEVAAHKCQEAESRPRCYEEFIPRYMDDGLPMESVFGIVRELQAIDPSYRDCHVLAHNISAKETAKDLSKWKDVVARSPYGVCGNGSSHGAFLERFRHESLPDTSTETILGQIRGACDDRDWWHPSHDERANCVHGVGHLAMYITGGDVKKSTDICTAFATEFLPEDFRSTCYEGVFMQVFQPLEDTDKLLVEGITPKYDDRMAFCNQFSGPVRSICVRESWILVSNHIATSAGFTAHCKPLIGLPDEYRYCAEGIGMGVFMVVFDYDLPEMMRLCTALDSTLMSFCVTGAARRYIQTDWRNIDEAIRVCRDAEERVHAPCFANLISYGQNTFTNHPKEAHALCAGMPAPWSKQCAEDLGISL